MSFRRTMSFKNYRILAMVCPLVLLGTGLLAGQSPKPAKMPPKTGSFRISGIAVNSVTSQPLVRARVSVTNTKDSKDTQSMMTGDDGRFEFQVDAGKYSLQGAKRGFITFSYDQHENFWTGIVTGAGLETENLVLRLPPASAITGTVTDDNGEPVRDAAVTVYREDHSTGITRTQIFSSVATDDVGTYEVTPLNSGNYFVTAKAQPWYAVHPASSPKAEGTASVVDKALDAAFPTAYYKDAAEPEDATPIPIRPADRAQVDLHLNAQPALHLVFHSTESAEHIRQPILQSPSFDGTVDPQPSAAQLVSPGTYEITGLPAGRYTMQVQGPQNGGASAPSEVNLTTDGQELDLSGTSPAASVKATVHLRGAAKLPDQFALVMRNRAGRFIAGSPNEQGEITFADVTPGVYDFVAGARTKAYFVSKITQEGHVSSGHTLNVPAGVSLTISLNLVGSALDVEGFAKRSGKAAAGVMVVLVPEDPDANLELFRRDQSDLDGSFTVRQVIPGTYTILAIEDGWDLDWAKPAVIESYRRHGQKIVVEDESKGSMQLAGPVEVQPKL